jgi:hypothetical protein
VAGWARGSDWARARLWIPEVKTPAGDFLTRTANAGYIGASRFLNIEVEEGTTMYFLRVFLAALAAFVAYMAVGGLAFGMIPSLRTEFLKYPGVYRSKEGQMSHMPLGMAGMFLAMVALTVIYAMLYQGGSGLVEGAGFGALVGLFAIGSFVFHNHVNLNIGWKLTLQQSVAYLVEWILVGMVLGLIYRPLGR